MVFDLALNDGFIVDGCGNPWFRGSVGIKDGRIVEVGSKLSEEAELSLNVKGLIVAPGFIDPHSHSDFSLMRCPGAESKIMQGVTTEVIGNCGFSVAPIEGEALEWAEEKLRMLDLKLEWRSFGEYLDHLERLGTSINVASLVGHGTVRLCVMGYATREPSTEELEKMKALVSDSMEAGAFGMSTGLVYTPGSYSTTSELIELTKVVADYDGIYTSHVRGERETMKEAVQELIQIGRETGIRLQKSHQSSKLGAFGRVKEWLGMEEEAREEGIDVLCDIDTGQLMFTGLFKALLPYTTRGRWPTDEELTAMIREREGRERLKREMILDQPPGPGQHSIVKHGRWNWLTVVHSRNRDLVGKSVEEIAEERGEDPFDTLLNLYLEEGDKRDEMRFLMFYVNEEDVKTVLKSSLSMISTDGSSLSQELADKFAPLFELGPRDFGTYPQVFRKYVREEKIITLEEAVRKMTSLPAMRFGIRDRGLIREGMWADIVAFDKNRIAEKGTIYDPFRYPVGIEYVLVNGVMVVERGRHTGLRPSEILRWKGKRSSRPNYCLEL